MSMITIKESGMVFGPFEDEKVFYIEKSKSYEELGNGIKAVEFIYRKTDNLIFFIEAKSSSPSPKRDNFEKYIDEISDKFMHSFNMLLTLILGRNSDDISNYMLEIPLDKQMFRFVLVINGHQTEWLPPIKVAIDRKLIAERKMWGHEIIVINDTIARKKGLIQ